MMEKFRFRKKETLHEREDMAGPQSNVSDGQEFNRFHPQNHQQQVISSEGKEFNRFHPQSQLHQSKRAGVSEGKDFNRFHQPQPQQSMNSESKHFQRVQHQIQQPQQKQEWLTQKLIQQTDRPNQHKQPQKNQDQRPALKQNLPSQDHLKQSLHHHQHHHHHQQQQKNQEQQQYRNSILDAATRLSSAFPRHQQNPVGRPRYLEQQQEQQQQQLQQQQQRRDHKSDQSSFQDQRDANLHHDLFHHHHHHHHHHLRQQTQQRQVPSHPHPSQSNQHQHHLTPRQEDAQRESSIKFSQTDPEQDEDPYELLFDPRQQYNHQKNFLAERKEKFHYHDHQQHKSLPPPPPPPPHHHHNHNQQHHQHNNQYSESKVSVNQSQSQAQQLTSQYYDPSQQRFNHDTHQTHKQPVSLRGPNEQVEQFPKTILKNRDPPSYHEFQRAKLLNNHQQQNSGQSSEHTFLCDFTEQPKPTEQSHYQSNKHRHNIDNFQQEQQQKHIQFKDETLMLPQSGKQSSPTAHEQQQDEPSPRQYGQNQHHLHHSHQRDQTTSGHKDLPPSLLQQHLKHQQQKQLTLHHQHYQLELLHEQQQNSYQQEQKGQQQEEKQAYDAHPEEISKKLHGKENALTEQSHRILRPKTPCRDLDNLSKKQNEQQINQQIEQHEQNQQFSHPTQSRVHIDRQPKDCNMPRTPCDDHSSPLGTGNQTETESSNQNSISQHLSVNQKHHDLKKHPQDQQQQHQDQQQQQQPKQQEQSIDNLANQEEPETVHHHPQSMIEEEDPRTPTPGLAGSPLSPTLTLLEYDQGRPPSGGTKVKQHTDWCGVLQDLFGLDSTHHHTAESTHESTSSGVASDVTSVYPASPPDGPGQLPLRSFKGGDSAGSASSDQQSQDSGNRSTSAPSSPKGDYPPNSHNRNLRQHGCLNVHALALDAARQASSARAGRRTPETHPLPPTPTDHSKDSDVPPPLPQRNITPRPNLSHTHTSDKFRSHDLGINSSHQSRGNKKPYLPLHPDRYLHNEAGTRTECKRPMSPRGCAESSPLGLACPCPACYSLAETSVSHHISLGYRHGGQNRYLRAADPTIPGDPASSHFPAECSLADSAVGLESFGYEGQNLGSKKLNDARANYSPSSPVPPGGFYHSKHFMPSFSEQNGFGHGSLHTIKPSTSHTRDKRPNKHYVSEDQRTFNPNINSEPFCQDCFHCYQQHKHHSQHGVHYHQMRSSNTTALQHHYNHNHHRNKTLNGNQSPSRDDLDKSNESLSRLEFCQNGRGDRHHKRRQNCGNNNIYSCSSSSPERVYYPHSDTTPTSTPTSHLSSDAAAVTSVNLDSNISTSSLTSHDHNHNCSNSSSSKAPSRLLPTSSTTTTTTTPSGRTRSITPRAPTGSEVKQHSMLLTSVEVHSPRDEDKITHGQTAANTELSQSESQESKSSSSPANPVSATANQDLLQATNQNRPSLLSPAQLAVPSKDRTNESPFETLPNDLLLRIFSHLPTDHLCKCAEVCRHWYNAVWDHPALWTSIVINNPNLDINRALKYLTRRLSYNTPKVCMILEKLNINGCVQLTDRGLQTVVKRCPELRCLDMQGCVLVTNSGLTEAVSRCVNLERLDVTGCPLVTCISLTESVLTCAAAKHLQRIYLRYLDMSDCPHITDGDLLTVSSQCTQLLFLYLRRCPLISDLGVSYIASNCGSLREVSMSDCRNVTDLGMRELAKLGENLRYLSVAKCEKVSDHGVSHIALNCPKLRYLNVRGCEAVSDRGLELLARSCLRLRSLDVGKCDVTDAGLYALSSYCPQLRKLGLKSCDGVTDRGLVLVAYRCPQLRQLHVQDCSRLTPEAYSMVRRYCKGAFIEHTNPGVL